MVNNIVKVVLAIACIVVGYLIYNTIAKTMEYKEQVRTIESGVITRLTEIKEAQFAFKDAYGKFADNFDTLLVALKTGEIPQIRQVGELVEDENVEIEIDTLYIPFKEKLKGKVNTPFDSLPYVPYSDKVMFELKAGSITRNGVEIQVFQAKDTMPFNKDRGLQIGSMTDAIYTGNWEKQE